MDDYIKYSSTRGGDDFLSYEEVLLAGLARDGGLFMPEKWPSFSHDDLKKMKDLTYSIFGNEVAPLKELKENTYILELFHGPTLAFKDYAMQFLAHVFDYVLKEKKKKILIVGATSGDTGSAALEAFKNNTNVD